MKLIALDPSTTAMGYAYEGGSGVLRAKGVRPQRLWMMQAELLRLLEITWADTVIYYRPFARGADATRCGWGIAGVIEALAFARLAAVMDITEGTVRKFYNFPKKAPREELKAFARQLAGVTSDDEADAILLYRYAMENVSR